MLVFVIECKDLGDLEEYFLWKKMWVGLRQGLMLCQRPLEVLSYWLSRTYRIVRSKISYKLFSVMRSPFHFPKLQENVPKTLTPCMNSLSMTIKLQNESPCGPIQFVDSLLNSKESASGTSSHQYRLWEKALWISTMCEWWAWTMSFQLFGVRRPLVCSLQ